MVAIELDILIPLVYPATLPFDDIVGDSSGMTGGECNEMVRLVITTYYWTNQAFNL